MNTKMIEIIKMLIAQNSHNTSILAEKSGVSQGTISKILRGTHKDPRPSSIKKIATVYGLTESQLRGDMPILLFIYPEALNKYYN